MTGTTDVLDGDDWVSGNGVAVARDGLRALVARIEGLQEHRDEIAAQIREVYAEAKAKGYDTATLRRVIALRRKDPQKRAEAAAMLDLYLSALGMQLDLDLDAPGRPRRAA